MKNFLKAYKIFKYLDLKVTLFVSGNKIGKDEYSEDLNYTENYLTIRDLICLDRNIVDIQNHGFNHIKLTEIRDNSTFREELVESKIFLEKIFEKDINIFCYPYGFYDTNIIKKLRFAGYQAACTTITGINKARFNQFLIKRIPVLSSDNEHTLDKKIRILLNNYEP